MYKNGNSARRTFTQRHIRPFICYGGSDNSSSGISGKLPKIATSNVIFSRTADRIAAKFWMTIKKIKRKNTFQSYVHPTSTLKTTNVKMTYWSLGCKFSQNNNDYLMFVTMITLLCFGKYLCAVPSVKASHSADVVYKPRHGLKLCHSQSLGDLPSHLYTARRPCWRITPYLAWN